MRHRIGPPRWAADPLFLGGHVFADPRFMDGLGPIPLGPTHSTSDVTTRALTIVGAESVPLVLFWTLTGLGERVAVHRGRDFKVWALPQRPVCANLAPSTAPPLRRTVLNFADAPSVTPHVETLLHMATNLAGPLDRATARAEIRVPPTTPKPPPPVRAPSERGNVQTTDVPSDYQSDWYGDWDYSNWKWNGSRRRRS